MPNQTVFNDYGYPTLADYFNAENPEGVAIIEETKKKSTFLTDAALVPTNDGTRYTYRREGEIHYNPRPASFDEGYSSEKQVLAGKELSYPTMRITDSIEWERKHKILSDSNGEALKSKQMSALTQSMIAKKADLFLYGEKAKAASYGLEIDGLMTHVQKTYNIDEYATMMSKLTDYTNHDNPFDTHAQASLGTEDLLCFSNQIDPDGNSSLGSGITAQTASAGAKFTSILGIAWGSQGVLSFFPEIGEASAGFVVNYTEGLQRNYADPRDGLTKRYVADAYDMDAYFGIGVLNRFCLSRLKNIYLFHADKAHRKAEMERVERYCIMMKDFFTKGETGMQMKFYCSENLVREMERYQKEMYPSAWYSNNSRNFDGTNPLVRPKEIAITSDITLVSDSVFRLNETFTA